MAAALVWLALVAIPAPAGAFEIFGLRLWGEAEEASAEQVPDPVPYAATLTVHGDSGVEDALRQASRLISEQETPPSGVVGLVNRARADQQHLVAALYGEGYYGGTVTITIDGRRYEDVPLETQFPADPPVPVAITADTGPQFVFGSVDAGVDVATAQAAGLEIVPGATARSGLILVAEQRLVGYWRQRGHPLAQAGPRSIRANHLSNTVDVRIAVDPGPPARFGPVHVEGARDVRPDLIASQAAIPAGEPFSPEALRTAETRLQALGVFNSVSVRTGDAVAPDGTIPVTITVTERLPRTIGAGLTASNTEGFGAEVYWVHRNLFGGAEQLRLEGGVARVGQTFDPAELDYRAAIIFAKPEAFGPATTLTTKLEAKQEHPDAFRRRGLIGEAHVSRVFTSNLTGRVGVEAEVAEVSDFLGTETYLLAGLPVELVYDSRDDLLNPTQGFHAILSATPMRDLHNGTNFVTARGGIASYWAPGASDRLVLAGRVAAGSILGAGLYDLPASRRFYAGGGGSIRGYAFQAAGPRNILGDPEGGLSLVEASLEARFRVTETVGIVPFIDAGGAFSSVVPGVGGDWFAGAGLGLRYLTPIGPLRLDVAVPLKRIAGDPAFGIYLGVGQAF